MYASMRENSALASARTAAREAAGETGERLNTTLLEHQVCAEAGLWETAVARRALGQSRGDAAHAVSMMRVWAATQPHLSSLAVDPADIVVLRRLTSAYPDIPSGQWLGVAPDLLPRQINWEAATERTATTQQPEPPATAVQPGASATAAQSEPAAVPTYAGTPRVRDLIDGARMVPESPCGEGADPARAVLSPPLARPSRLAVLARGETGALVALAALVLGRRREAVMVELRVGIAGVRIPHPRTGAPCLVAEVPLTEAEVVLDAEVDGGPGLATGWGATMGTVERRAISLALLDAAMRADGELREPVEIDEQTVIAATDGPGTTGFVEHLRLPHYATFNAYITGVTEKAT